MKKQFKSRKKQERKVGSATLDSAENVGSSDTFKLLCSNCEEDITYIFRKGQEDMLNKVLKEIDDWVSNLRSGTKEDYYKKVYGNDFGLLKNKLEEMKI